MFYANPRQTLHRTITASADANGDYAFSVGSLDRFSGLRLLFAADSSENVTGRIEQGDTADAYEVNSTFSVSSGILLDVPCGGRVAQFTFTPSSASTMRVTLFGIPIEG